LLQHFSFLNRNDVIEPSNFISQILIILISEP